jgi:hypothetical protein
MPYQFRQHYTVAEAEALLPRIRNWLGELRHLRKRLERLDEYLGERVAQGDDLGGARVNDWIRQQGRIDVLEREFSSREIQLKDLDRGLVDFPALRGDREVFLCWEEGESQIEHYHELDSGFAGREPI